MKSNEDNKTWISNILVRNIFCMFKTSLLLLNFCLCVYMCRHKLKYVDSYVKQARHSLNHCETGSVCPLHIIYNENEKV